jgi:alpha-methylacyl-CoA racemase
MRNAAGILFNKRNRRNLSMANGPLQGLKVVEFAGIGPGPFCGMLLSDMGADVVRIDRKGGAAAKDERYNIDRRGRRSVALDLKRPESLELCLKLCEKADIVFEGHRPGVMERLGLGPDAVLGRNPRIVYGRMTGWGQYGPYANRAGHDINYIAISGALDAIGTGEKPIPPLNLVGDYGGGAMFLAFGLLAAVLSARSTGRGQVVDVAMTDGVAYLTAVFHRLRAVGLWKDERSANLLDGGAPFYDTYRCADGKWIAVGAIEPQFYQILLEKTGLAGAMKHGQMDRSRWPEMKKQFAEVFATRTRDEWCAQMGADDACFAPVLSIPEAMQDPHNVARKTFVEIDGVPQPAPAPRFSATPGEIQSMSQRSDTGSRRILEDWGIGPDDAAGLAAAGVIP